MNNPPQKRVSVRPTLIISFILTLATVVVYWQVNSFQFTNYDDYDYVAANRYVQQGLSFDSIVWAFQSFHAANWHPVTWLSHMIDVELYGISAGAHHLMNLLFHIINTLLLFHILNKMTEKIWPSAGVALLFALHPLHVESVAWVAERKDLLCALFSFLTINKYIDYSRTHTSFDYGVALLFFTLGLMSKPMIVTLPLLLLLIDYWPLKTISFASTASLSDFFRDGFGSKRYLSDKLPFFLLVIISCVVTVMAQSHGGAMGNFERYPLFFRMNNAIVSYGVYLGKFFWPADLSVFYPYEISRPIWQIMGSLLLISWLTGLSLLRAKKWPFFFVGWSWYLVSLVPVIGLVQVGAQAYADRYTYLPSIGIFIIFTWMIEKFVSNHAIKPWLSISVVLSISALIMRVSWLQASHWENSETLFSHSTHVVKNNYIGHNNWGCYLTDTGKIDEAISHFQEAIYINPLYTGAYMNLGRVLLEQSRLEEAISVLEMLLQHESSNGLAHYYLGLAFLHKGAMNEAVSAFQKLFRLAPDFHDTTMNFALYLIRENRIEEARFFLRNTLFMEIDVAAANLPIAPSIPEKQPDTHPENDFRRALTLHYNKEFEKAELYYRKAIQAGYTSGVVYLNFGSLLVQMGKMTESIVYFNKTLDYNWMPPSLFNNFSVVHIRQERLSDSVRYLDEAIRKEPSFSEAHNNLGVSLSKQGRFADAEKQFRKAIELKPLYVNAMNNLGLLMVQQEKFNEALDHFFNAVHISPDNPNIDYFIATTYALQNDSKNAASWMQKAIDKGFDRFNMMHNDIAFSNLKPIHQWRGVPEPSPH